MKEINLVKKLISLLLISVCLGDTLILKDKTEYTGTLIKFGNDEIMFRALPSAKLSINISDIQELKLSDGTRVIENGIVVASNEKHIKKISYSRYLSVGKAEEANISKTILGCCIVIIAFGLMSFTLILRALEKDIGRGELPTL